jgi:hypothetical protein
LGAATKADVFEKKIIPTEIFCSAFTTSAFPAPLEESVMALFHIMPA